MPAPCPATAPIVDVFVVATVVLSSLTFARILLTAVWDDVRERTRNDRP